jgi:hypothetical protein
MRILISIYLYLGISVSAAILSGCGSSLNMPESTPSIAARVGTAIAPGDEVAIVFNPVTGAFEQRPITGGATVVTPPPISYNGITN